MAASFAGKAEIVHRRVALWVAGLLTVTGLLPREALLSFFGAGIIGQLLQLVGAGALLLWFMNVWPVRRRGRLEADAKGLSIGGRLLAPREAIAGAYVLVGEKPTARIVRKRFRGFPIDVHVKNDKQARAVVEALGLGVSSSTAVFDVLYGGMRGQLLAALFGVVSCVIAGAVFLATAGTLTDAFPLVAVALVLAAAASSRAQVHVGTDGLLVARVGSKTFIPFGEIEGIDHEGALVVVRRRNGARVRFGFGTDSEDARAASGALLRRIEEARAAFERGESGADAAALLERGPRTTGEWIANLRRLVEGGSYREAAALPERLYRIVEDPSEPEATRAGAAVALGPVLDADGRARLRVAAEASASPKLRVALERASDEGADAEAIEEALGSLDPEAKRAAHEQAG